MSKVKQHVLVDLSKTKSLYNGPGQFCLRLGNELQKLADDHLHPTFLIGKRRAKLLSSSSKKYWTSHFIRDVAPQPIKTVMAFQQPKLDLWHVTAQDSSYWPFGVFERRRRIPTILTIHDLNFLREKSQEKIEKRLVRLQNRVDRADVITTISNFSAAEIRRYLNLKEKPLHTIYNGGAVLKGGQSKKPTFILPNKKILFTLGELTAKKNVHTLLPIIEGNSEYQLVVAGKNATLYGSRLRETVRQLGLENRVLLPGTISDEERLWLYQNCTAFLFPSLTEGFGLPVLEAMQFGKPVFMSKTTSLPEVGGDAGFYWENYKPEVMKRCFKSGMQIFDADPLKFADIAKSRAAQFSWKKSAAAYWALYQEVLQRG